jgi:hypothetical protein
MQERGVLLEQIMEASCPFPAGSEADSLEGQDSYFLLA